MENPKIKELVMLKQLLQGEVRELSLDCNKLLKIAVEDSLNIASACDVEEEERLGNKYINHMLDKATELRIIVPNIVKEMTKQAPSNEIIDNTSKVSPWKVDSLGCHPVSAQILDISGGNCEKCQSNSVRWSYGDINSDDGILISALVEYVIQEQGIMPSIITSVNISLVDILEEMEPYFVKTAISSLIKYCNDSLNIPLFFNSTPLLFEMWENRQNILLKYNLRREFELEHLQNGDETFTIIFSDASRGIVASLFWTINFDVSTCSVQEKIVTKFSTLGKELAKECCLEEDLIETGRNDYWSAEDYVKNITKMTSLYCQSPTRFKMASLRNSCERKTQLYRK
jgi:hypothetical protein